MTGITLADTSPNFALASWPPTAISTLVAEWGRTPNVRGSLFYAWPHLVRTADSADRPWPDSADPIYLWVYPAVT